MSIRSSAAALVAVAVLSFAFCGRLAFAGAADDVKEGAEKIVESGKEKIKDTVDKAKDEIEKTRKSFWEKANPFIVLPATLLAGLVIGFFLGYRRGKGKDKKKK